MTGAPVPIPLVLDLWSEGYSASDIAEKLGFPNGKHIARIVAHARELGDKRAVFHRQGWRIQGKGIPPGDRDANPLQKTYRNLKIVQVASKPCKRGHSPSERNERSQCRVCKKITDRLRYQAMRGLR